MNKLNTFSAGPDDTGHFGIFGGRYVAETLMPLILEVEKAYNVASNDPKFWEGYSIIEPNQAIKTFKIIE